MIKAPISYTGFKTPETVELSDSDLAVLCAHDPNAKSLIMKARRLALWEQFDAFEPGSDFRATFELAVELAGCLTGVAVEGPDGEGRGCRHHGRAACRVAVPQRNAPPLAGEEERAVPTRGEGVHGFGVPA